ncbi:MAG: MFS transporter [Xanthomonadales bacterium]|nr:MFS transporter [Xanthomonadales bacterium]
MIGAKNKNTTFDIRHWLIMVVLSVSGGMIFMAPFLREVYYIPMQEAMNLSNTEMGMLMGVFGAVGLLTYFPGGWLADRVSSRKLITLGMISTGVSGLYFATFPGYTANLLLHAFWGISITLVFWGAMIKATRGWAPADEQGRAFGILETGRGLSEVLSHTALLALFAWLGSTFAALSTVIVSFSLFNVGLGVAAWFLLEDNQNAETASDKKVGVQEVLQVLKMPVVWLISLVILCAYSAYWGSFFFTPYASDVFLMSVTMAGVLSVGRMWLKPVAALAAGFLGDRFGISKTVAASLAITAASFGLFALTPANPAVLPLVIINVAISATFIFALRGIYFALLEEGGIPIALTGTAAGVASAIGFIPDIYMPVVGGYLLDGYPGVTGYRMLFGFVAILAVIGFIAAVLIMRLQKPTAESVHQDA